MTLLIACILIYHFGLPPWWYAMAFLVWTWHLAFQLWMSTRHLIPNRHARVDAFFSHGLASEPPRPEAAASTSPHGIAANE